MYGGSGKFGRGGGSGGRGGAGLIKRNVHSTTFQPSSIHRQRPSTAPAASRNRTTSSSSNPGASSVVEESFSLVTGNPLNYAMIIKLTPDLVEEIKRVEAQGGAARIKFDSNPTNTSGVIDVGGKDFRFKWAQEVEGLLETYEERRSGVDGNGLLVESGVARRKVNVQRVLDESTKNHVKMRSEEAERKQKSRRAIVLDHGNPIMKNQIKALAAVEVNQWRYKQKKEPPSKKIKAETLSARGPPKSASKSGLASSAPPKLRPSTSPPLSSHDQSGGPLSPFKTSSVLEKAIGAVVPSSVRQIEPVLNNIADFQVPGRYFLKPEIELDSFKKPSPQNGSSPEDNHQHTLAFRNNFDQVPTQEPNFSSKHDIKEGVEQDQLNSKPVNELNPLEKIDARHSSPDLFGEIKVPENSEGPAGSSSISGSSSDSESDSSDTDSGSAKSRSPMGSQSGSSSDSDSDASSNSKEGSDEDVDILSDDDKEPKHLPDQSEHDLFSSPIPWRAPEGGLVQNLFDEKHDGHDSDIVETEKVMPKDDLDADIDVVNDSFPYKGGEKLADETNIPSPGFHEHQKDQVQPENPYRKRENVAESRSRNEQFDVPERIFRSKSKRHSDGKNLDNNLEPTKKTKIENLNRPHFFGGENSLSSTEKPDKYADGSGGSMKLSERSHQMHNVFPVQKDRVNEVEDIRTNGKRPPKSSKLGSAGEKFSDSHYRKRGELIDVKFPATNGRGSTLRRELSELELGELREPLHEESSAAKNQFERKSPFKLYENKSTSDYRTLNTCKGKPTGRSNADSSKESPIISNSFNNPHKGIQSQFQQPSGSGHLELGFQNNKGEEYSKVRRNEANGSQGNGVEGYGDSQRKVPTAARQQQGTRRGAALISTKENKRKDFNSLADTNEKQKGMPLSESNVGGLKESLSDEDIGSYSKYEKEAAELKGPIKDFSQYEEYVREYREKYDSYCSLNAILESHRDKFLKLGRDLELAKGRDKDKYDMISRQMVESYRRIGTKNKRLKHIYVILHEEVKNLKQIIRDYAVAYNKD